MLVVASASDALDLRDPFRNSQLAGVTRVNLNMPHVPGVAACGVTLKNLIRSTEQLADNSGLQVTMDLDAPTLSVRVRSRQIDGGKCIFDFNVTLTRQARLEGVPAQDNLVRVAIVDSHALAIAAPIDSQAQLDDWLAIQARNLVKWLPKK